MAAGAFVRLNAHLLNSTDMGEGQLISIVGSMEATDGETITLKTSDEQSLVYRVAAEIDFAKVRNMGNWRIVFVICFYFYYSLSVSSYEF